MSTHRLLDKYILPEWNKATYAAFVEDGKPMRQGEITHNIVKGLDEHPEIQGGEERLINE